MHLRSVSLHPDRYPVHDRYPFTLPVLRETTHLSFETPVTLFVGENGTGKSTVLEAIALKCGIHIWRDAERLRFEYNPYEHRLCDYFTLEWTAGRVPGSYFGSGIFVHFALALDGWAANDPGQLEYFGGQSLLTQSHGQSLMSFFRARYQRRGVYFLDEPETALTPKTQLELLRLLVEMSRAGHAQFVVATHSPILLACPGATIYSFDRSPVSPIEYEDTDHYRVYAEFMADRQVFLRDIGRQE